MSAESPSGVLSGAPDERRCVSLWSLREDVLVDTSSTTGSVLLSGRWGEVRLRGVNSTVREALRRMSLGPISLTNVAAELVPSGPERAPRGLSVGPSAGSKAEILMVLHRVQQMVVRSLTLEGADRLLLSAVPIAPAARCRPVPAGRRHPVRLSRFAFLRSEGKGFVLESPTSLYRMVLHGPEASWVVGMLGLPATTEEIAAALPLSLQTVSEIIALLLATGMAVPADSGEVGEEGKGQENGHVPGPAAPCFAEDRDPALQSWSAVDLLFHSRSTLGRHDADFGATYPLAERMPPAPAVKSLPDGPRIALPRPVLDEVVAGDPPLTTVLEERRSIRSYGASRLTAAALGEFLYRALRVRGLREHHGDGRPPDEYTDRPYPSGGRAYELEFYLTVRDCAGIPAGIHYYAPVEHCLVRIGDAEQETAVPERIEEARIVAGLADPPSVVITITSRFHRLAWKYSGLAYALTLKHVGAVTQNLYLIATAMGLAPCALGSGDVDLAARTTGTDWRIEPGVGGFALGTRREERSPVPHRPSAIRT
ncbi:SagB/ThcOx family dehydrogenase [Streptomyces mayonensis]|uniref:SagB/ThcOx family dehydrogenase n=1 Tax=Streptomyces mayonensis TaxID=2750816 RepID=UPI001C1E893C|nr:SagB family peptide dehydrogenase [Streptomyces sp. A108]MBU6533327.1 SagB family peptide dehydrogenase [Streptomyces sp. A108]